MTSNRRAFTLIELLVVITIIVVLLALLTPALDRAIYQAELVSCAARQDGIASGATLYAYDYKRRYPNRPGNRETEDTTSLQPFKLRNGRYNYTNDRDLRPIIQDHIPAKLWPDPLAGDIDLSIEATKTNGGVTEVDQVYAGVNFFFGFTYTKTPNFGGAKVAEKGMIKIGDRWTFYNQNEEYTGHYNLLTSDVDWQNGGGESFGSHPDKAGTLINYVVEGADAPWVADGTVTWSWWQKGSTTNPRRRGFIDINYSTSDGSVGRITDVDANRNADDRVDDIAMFDTRFGWSGEWLNIPKG